MTKALLPEDSAETFQKLAEVRPNVDVGSKRFAVSELRQTAQDVGGVNDVLSQEFPAHA